MNLVKKNIRAGVCLLALSFSAGILPATQTTKTPVFGKSVFESKPIFVPKAPANWDPQAKTVPATSRPELKVEDASRLSCLFWGAFGPIGAYYALGCMKADL